MAMPTFEGLLIVITVTQCLAAWEHTPIIPAGRRVQYYLLRKDGGYKHGYDTGDGQTAQAVADNANEVQGKFSYTGSSGEPQILAYTAGVDGYLPRTLTIESSQVAPALVSTPLQLDSYSLLTNVKGQHYHNSNTGGDKVINNNEKIQTGLATKIATENCEKPADASYSFGYSVEGHSRSEESDKYGNVKGTYTTSTGDGVERKIDYEAGENKGFVIKSLTSKIKDFGGIQHTYNSGNYNAKISLDGRIQSNAYGFNENHNNGQTNAFVKNELSNSFISTGNHAAHKTGANSFFVPSSHLATTQSPLLDLRFPYRYSSFAPVNISPVVLQANNHPTTLEQNAELPTYHSNNHADASYSFSYETSDQSRQESSDANGNVEGSYSFVAKDDGVRRTVNYEANSASGFLAKGLHLPTPTMAAKNYPNLQNQLNNGYKKVSKSKQEPSKAQGYFSYNGGDVGKTVQHSLDNKGFLVTGDHLHPQEHDHTKTDARLSSVTQNAAGNDGAYSYSYKTDSSSKQETSDTQGNVVGSFSFIGGDGVGRTVQYTADGQGFVPTGDHLPRQEYDQTKFDARLSSVTQNAAGNDGAYSYSYKTDSSSKQETSDTKGNVVGSFSFIGGDGVGRTVQYTADGQGFVPTGDHLPRQEYDQTKPDARFGTLYAGEHVGGSFSYITGNGLIKNKKYTANSHGFATSADNLLKSSGINIDSSVKSLVSPNNHDSFSSTLNYNVGLEGKPALYTVQTYLPHSKYDKYGYIYDSKV